jgi:serine phosphatase RsbU (regulator of sigma subunit)
VIVRGSDEELLRLITVVDRQRRELDRIRTTAGEESMVAMARGALMERLGLSSAEAAGQLAELAAATGVPLAEMAASVLSEPREPSQPGDGPGRRTEDEPGRRNSVLLTEAAAELAADGTELVGTLAAQVLDPLGATAVILWLLEADGTLTLLGEQGLSDSEAGRWRHIPPQLDCPAQRVAHGAADLWWPAGRRTADRAPVIGPTDGARVVLALRERSGGLLGVMEVGWPGPQAFTAELRQHLSALAAGCAPVIAARLAHGDLSAAQPRQAVYALLDDLAESVLVARAIRDDAGGLTDFGIEHVSPGFRDPTGRTETNLTTLTLLEAYPASVAGSGLFARAKQVLADGTAQHVPGPLRVSLIGGRPAGETEADEAALTDLRVARFFDGVIVTWHSERSTDRLAAVLEHAQRLGRIGGWEENLVTGAVRWTDSAFGLFGLTPHPGAEIPLVDLHSYVMAADKPVVKRFRQRLPEQRDALTATFRVVHPDDGSIRQIRVFAEPVVDAADTVVALRGAFQDISAHYHTQVALAATRDQLADSEQRVAEEHLLALRLQQAIMPPDEQPAEMAGIDVAVRYRPVGEGHLVGGDWYDTLLLPGKEVLLVVGDVAGHGIDAVTGMVAARNSLRGLAITGAGPAELLRMLNGVMCDLTSGVVGTVVCGLYHPETSVLRWARAGHLPPVLVRGRTARQLPLPAGVLLGMDPDASYEEATQSLRPGDTLLLFTDGLIERRDESIVDVLGEFVATVAPDPESPETPGGQDGPEPTAAAQADRIMAAAVSDTDDDACLVAVRIRELELLRGPVFDRAALAVPVAGPGYLRQSLLQARETGEHLVKAGDREDTQDSHAGRDQQYLAAFGLRSLARAHQGVQPGRIAEPRPGQVHHERPEPVCGRFEQRRPEHVGVGDVDLFRRRHHGHAADRFDRE